jgi:hypothetical protein
MEEKNYSELIPRQKNGRKITAEATTEFQMEAQANAFYKEARKRLLTIRNWHSLAGRLSADFRVTDNEGKEVDRTAQKAIILELILQAQEAKPVKAMTGQGLKK